MTGRCYGGAVLMRRPFGAVDSLRSDNAEGARAAAALRRHDADSLC
jgi:hypothetical protein